MHTTIKRPPPKKKPRFDKKLNIHIKNAKHGVLYQTSDLVKVILKYTSVKMS